MQAPKNKLFHESTQQSAKRASAIGGTRENRYAFTVKIPKKLLVQEMILKTGAMSVKERGEAGSGEGKGEGRGSGSGEGERNKEGIRGRNWQHISRFQYTW